jgi:hypothetical protein
MNKRSSPEIKDTETVKIVDDFSGHNSLHLNSFGRSCKLQELKLSLSAAAEFAMTSKSPLALCLGRWNCSALCYESIQQFSTLSCKYFDWQRSRKLLTCLTAQATGEFREIDWWLKIEIASVVVLLWSWLHCLNWTWVSKYHYPLKSKSL